MPKTPIRPIRIEGQVAYVPLTQGYEAVIDANDVYLIQGENWKVEKRTKCNVFYACATRKSIKNRLLHRAILMPKAGYFVDHVNGDGLDNRRMNLRLASHAENTRNQRLSRANTSGFKGVSFNRKSGKWRATISVDKKAKWLGLYESAEDAYKAYCTAAVELHGEYARLA